MVCPGCREEIVSLQNFCPNCGCRLKPEEKSGVIFVSIFGIVSGLVFLIGALKFRNDELGLIFFILGIALIALVIQGIKSYVMQMKTWNSSKEKNSNEIESVPQHSANKPQTNRNMANCADWNMENENDKKAIRNLVYNQSVVRNSQPGNIFSTKLNLQGVTRPVLFTIDSKKNLSEMYNAIALPSTFRYKKEENLGVVVFVIEFITDRYLLGLQSVVDFIKSRPQGALANINMPTTTIRECVFFIPSDKETLMLLEKQKKWLLLLIDSSANNFKWIDISNENWKTQIEQSLHVVKDCKEASNQSELKKIMKKYYEENPMSSLICSDIEKMGTGIISVSLPVLQSEIEEKLRRFGR